MPAPESRFGIRHRSLRAKLLVAAAALLVLLAVSASAVLAVGNYDGEDFCRQHPAWPGGTYLGQMHRFHVQHYIEYADALDTEPCRSWAAEQRGSAINGLRALGYVVYGPYPQPFVVWGRGNRTIPVNLDAGLYSVKVRTIYDGPQYLEVRLHSTALRDFEQLAGDELEGEWTSEVVLPVGNEHGDYLRPGDMVLEVTSRGAWFVTFTRVG